MNMGQNSQDKERRTCVITKTLTSNGHGQRDAHDSGECSGGSKHGEADVEGGVHHVPAHGTNVGSQETSVEGVAARQQQRGRVKDALELAVGHQGAAEGHAANVCAEEEGRLDGVSGGVGGKVREVVEVCGDTGEHSGCSDQAEE